MKKQLSVAGHDLVVVAEDWDDDSEAEECASLVDAGIRLFAASDPAGFERAVDDIRAGVEAPTVSTIMTTAWSDVLGMSDTENLIGEHALELRAL